MKDADISRTLRDAVSAASEMLLMRATNPWELDEAMTQFGFAMGVCEAQDIAGLDFEVARRSQLTPSGVLVLPRMVAEGRLGRRVGVGWYRYPGGGGLVIDPLVEDLLREEARFAGITRHDMTDAELVDYLVLAAIKAATALLPRIQSKGHDRINRLSIESLGFPAETGGLLAYADEIELSSLVQSRVALS